MHLIDDPEGPAAAHTDFATFREIDIRIGTVLEAAPLEGARSPALRLVIDFGPGVGVKKSSAQVTEHYSPETLVGKQVAGVVNFPPRQIGKFMSEVLTLGFADAGGAIVMFSPDKPVPNGARLA
ncbi:MAG: tRNA-binding protein [Hyphomonadaceae bacterium BRH_c29]|jgi:tRNA-binding protein|nr:MAG: tRNA-binding protein [Hyphomonadaceae bacterium BRH_c29]